MFKKRQLFWLLSLTNGYRKIIIFPLALSILSIVLSLVFVELLRDIVDGISSVGYNFILSIIFLVGIKLLQFICEEGETYFRCRASAILENAYSLRCFTKLFSSSALSVKSLHSGDEMNRLNTDVSIVTQCVSYTLPIIIYAFAQLVLTSVYLLSVKPILTIILICIMPIMIFIARYYTCKLIPVSKEIRERDGMLNQYMQEHLQKHELLSSLGITRHITQTVRNLQQVLFGIIKKQIRYDVAAEAFVDLGFTIGYIAVLIWGLLGIRNGNFTYAMLLVFMELVGQLERPFILLKTQYPILVTSFASAERLIELENLPFDDTTRKIEIKGAIGIAVENIYFSYNESDFIFNNFSYVFNPNTITAIIGETGIGKTTLFKLILSHLSPSSGSIYFFSDDGEKIPASSYTRCNCTYVPQGNSLLSGSIRYNLSLGNLNATETEMIKVLKTATADFVFNLPDGLDTVIGENGFGLSEGQSQRIAIARGLLRPSGILLLDEPTSALDSETSKLLLHRLTVSCSNRTVIIISHDKEILKYVQNSILIKHE